MAEIGTEAVVVPVVFYREHLALRHKPIQLQLEAGVNTEQQLKAGKRHSVHQMGVVQKVEIQLL